MVLHRVGFGGRKLLKERSKIEMLISGDLVNFKVLRTSEICKLSRESLINANSNLEAQYADIAQSRQKTDVVCH